MPVLHAAPHSVYACKGEDRWCTIAVLNDDQWIKLCQALGKPDYMLDARFDTLLHRKEHEKELDGLVEDWTKEHTPEEVMAVLQKAGVPAGIVENPADVFSDPQLRHRGLFWPINHSEIGMFNHLGSSVDMSETPAQAADPQSAPG